VRHFYLGGARGLKLNFLFERFAYTNPNPTYRCIHTLYPYHCLSTRGLSQRNCGSSNALSNTIQSRLQDLAYNLNISGISILVITRLKTLIGSLPISLARLKSCCTTRRSLLVETEKGLGPFPSGDWRITLRLLPLTAVFFLLHMD
jgi:hypothetical protein